MTHEEEQDMKNKIKEEVSRLTNESLITLINHHIDWYHEYVCDVDEDCRCDVEREIQILREGVNRINSIDKTNK